MQANISMRGGKIVFVFSGGGVRKTSVRVDKSMSEAGVISAVVSAASEARAAEMNNLERFNALSVILKSAPQNAMKLLAQLRGSSKPSIKTEPARKERVQKDRVPPRQIVPKKTKELKITLPIITKAINSKDTILSGTTLGVLAKNIPSLDRFLSTATNRKRLSNMIFSSFNKMTKYDLDFTLIPIGEKRNPPIELKSSNDPVALRLFLAEYIGKGNPIYAKELASLGGIAINNSPLDGKTLIAAIAYLRRFNYGELNLKSKPLDPLILTPLTASSTKDVVLPAATQPVAKPTPAPKETFVPRVAIIGDSLTGEFKGQKAGYPMNLLSLIQAGNKSATVTPYGIKGQSSGEIASRFTPDILGKGYNTVVIQAGTNDLYSNTKINDPKVSEQMVVRVTANIEKMVRAAKSAKPPLSVILLTIHPQRGYRLWTDVVQQRIDNINKWIMSQAGKGVTVVDLSSLGDKDGRILKGLHNGGGLHFSGKGGVAVAKLIFEQGFKSAALKTVQIPEKTAAEYEKIASSVRTRLTQAIKFGDTKILSDFEASLQQKDMLATIPEKMASLRKEMLYLPAQAAFNHLKDNDPGFNRFLLQNKGKDFNELIDLPGVKVRMHEREVGTRSVNRQGKIENMLGEKGIGYESAAVKAIQLYLGYRYNFYKDVKSDFEALYGEKGAVGKKRVMRSDGVPDRAFFYEFSAYARRIRLNAPVQEQNKAPEQKHEQQKVPVREL